MKFVMITVASVTLKSVLQATLLAVRAHFRVLRTCLQAVEEKQTHIWHPVLGFAFRSCFPLSGNRGSAVIVDLSFSQGQPDLPCRWKDCEVFWGTFCSHLPRLSVTAFLLRNSSFKNIDCIKAQGTLKNMIAVFHGFNITSTDMVVWDSLLFSQGIWLLEGQ